MAEVKDNILELNKVYSALNTTITENIKHLERGAVAVEKYNKVISIKPSDYSKGIEEINTKTKELEKSQKNLEATEKKLQQTRLQEIKLQQQREKAFDNFDKKLQATNKQIEKEQQLLEKSKSIYNQVQQRVNNLTKTYNDIAIKRELGLKLSKDEEGQLLSLETRLKKYQTALYNVDAGIGKHQRNVGNYASGFNGLSNSINQITRELPAFTFSAQTGFLALSNNIPILTDEIGRLIDKNKELVKQGQPVKSVFSQILSSLFSLQTAMGVGILMFTLYGKEIGEFVSGLFKTKKAFSELEEQNKRYNETLNTLNQNSSRIASDEISRSKILLETAKNTSLSYKQRIEAVNELQSRYPDYLGNLSKEKILSGETAEAQNLLTQALINRATAMASMEMIEDNVRKKLEAEKKLNLELAKIEKERLEQGKNKVFATSLEDEAKANEQRDKILRQGYANERMAKIRYEEKIALIKEEEDVITNIFNKNAQYLNIVNTKEEKQVKIKKEKVILLKNELTDLQKLSNAYEDYIKKQNELILAPDRKINVGANQEMYNVMLSQRIKNLDKEIESETNNYQEKERLFQLRKKLILEELNIQMISEFTGDEFKDNAIKLKYENLRNEINKTKTPLQELSDLAQETAKSMVDNFANGVGMQTTFDILNGNIEGFGENWLITTNAIIDATAEMYNFINSMSQENFQAEYERENMRKENAILFAGESADAKAEIEKESERRTREIRKRELQAQKKMAIFQATIDTVKGVVGALSASPWSYMNIVNAALVGALGAVQIAKISSQQIPQYWKGTDNAQEGLAWTNERGREIITDAKGKIKDFGTDKGATLKYLNKGDKVLKHSDTMRELDNILMQNNISKPLNNNINIDLLPLQKDIKELTNIIANKSEFTIVKDMQGERYYKRVNGQRQELKNTILNLKTRNV
jgi:Skp family chaperone for outer membrane proteins